MILNKHGHKRTANEFAKEVVQEFGDGAYFYITQYQAVYVDKATVREGEAIERAIANQQSRVAKLLGNPDPRRSK